MAIFKRLRRKVAIIAASTVLLTTFLPGIHSVRAAENVEGAVNVARPIVGEDGEQIENDMQSEQINPMDIETKEGGETNTEKSSDNHVTHEDNLMNGQKDNEEVEKEQPKADVPNNTKSNKTEPVPETAPVIGEPNFSIDASQQYITIEVPVTSGQEVTSVQIFVKQSEAFGYETVTMEKSQDGIYIVTLPLAKIWSNAIEYYFTATNGSGEVTSTVYQEKLPTPSIDYQKVPKLLITEIAPNTDNVGRSDGYEFIEIYNNSNQPINMKDYKVIYRYPNSTPDQIWDITDDKWIEPKESFIVWIHNLENRNKTVADFNKQYNLNLTEDHVAIVQSDGLANGSERTLILSDEAGQEIVAASYNNGSNDNQVNRGITYKYPIDGTSLMQKVGLGQTITPAIVFPEQVPNETVQVKIEEEVPGISGTKLLETESGLAVETKVTSNTAISSVKLYFNQSSGSSFEVIQMEKHEGNDSTYQVLIPHSKIWGDQIQYYIVATNEAGEAKTETMTYQLVKEQVDYQKLPELLITEIVPDSSNISGADAYEFIEIYNNTNEAINFKDYTIRYRYPGEDASGDLLWQPEEDVQVIIPAGESVVFWNINKANAHLTAMDFNTNYGTNLIEGKNLFRLYNNGLANSSQRTLIVSTKTGYEISAASYFDEVGVDDTAPDKGIFYKYPIDGSIKLKKISGGTLKATPGSVMPEQVPEQRVTISKDEIAPSITDTTTEGKVETTKPFIISAKITDNKQVKTATLYYRIGDGEFTKVNLVQSTNEKDVYEYTIYEPELIGKDKLEYYLTANDGKNETRTDNRMLTIQNPQLNKGFRLNVGDNELLSGEKIIKATAATFTEETQLYFDGVQVNDTFMAMESEAYFAFDVRKTNLYFQNGVTMGEEILKIFDDTINGYTTLTVPVSPDHLKQGENVITIRAGNKVSPFDETSTENRDDFYIKNVRLVLADGTTIYDPNYGDPTVEYSVGDSAGMKSVYDFTFTIDQEKFTSKAFLFNTASVKDGKHEIKAVLHDKEIKTEVITDNTGPIIKPTVENAKEYKGKFTIDAHVDDVTSEVEKVTATFDGKAITLPYETSSAQLQSGIHKVVYTATDAAGNSTTKTVEFKVVDEHPTLPEWMENDPDATSAKLSVRVNDPTGDTMNVAFYQGYQYTADDYKQIKISQNTSSTEPPEGFLPIGERVLTEEETGKLFENDGTELATESMTEFPYHRFDITVEEAVDVDDEVEVVWNGSSLSGRKVTMYAWNHSTEQWDALVSTIAGNESFQLVGKVKAGEYVKDDKISVIVQDQVAKQGEDFSFVWMSDTQYYSESYPYIYEKQVKWIAENRNALNIEYVFHTGDLVDEYDDMAQWDVADRSMKVLDEANIPYGVLAGNHDVDQKTINYDNYYQFFGADRFENRSYYGESYLNNRGHYDLLSVNGIDFIMIYMGWGVDEEGIDWMNQVLADHPNRIAILNFHEYLLASGSRSPIGNEIFQKVVLPNENVIAVLSGHYHNAQTLIDPIDDNGDGASDRTVYQMLADYQGGPEGGQGYMRILNFDMDANQIYVQTYSPYMDDYNYYNPEEFPEKDEFIIPFDMTAQTKKVATDYVEVNVYTNKLIDQVENVTSGEVATVLWNGLEPEKEYFWYAESSDEFGGKSRSKIWSVVTKEGEIVEPETPEIPAGPEEPETPGDGQNNNGGKEDNEPGVPISTNKQVVEPVLNGKMAMINDSVFDKVNGKGNIVLDLNNQAKLESLEIHLTEAQIEKMKRKSLVLTIQKGDIVLDIPASVFAGRGNAVISIERQERVAKSLSNVYKLSVKQGEKLIKSFLEGITMTLAVEAKNVGQLADIKIRNWNGQKWGLIGGEYADGKVTAAINQPGTFAAFEHTDEKNVAGDSKNGNGVLPETATNLINLIVTGFLLLLVASILLVAYRRRKFGLDSK